MAACCTMYCRSVVDTAFMDLLRATCLLIAFSMGAAWADERLFRERIAPILEARCVHCHEGAKPKGGLSLVSAERLRAGGDSGPVIAAGKPDESLLLEYISGDEPEMPKDGKPLSAAEVAAIREWIASGAAWPADDELTDKRQHDLNWWSLRPLVRPSPPAVTFGLGSHADRRLHPGQAARARSWRRRRRPTAARSSAACTSISSACRRRPTKSRRSSPTTIRTPTRNSSIGCSPRRTTASAGAGTGSTSSTTATRTATTRTSCGRTPGRIATT